MNETEIQDLMIEANDEQKKKDFDDYRTAVARNAVGQSQAAVTLDPTWVNSSKIMYQYKHGKAFEGTDEEAARFGFEYTTNANLPYSDTETPWGGSQANQWMADMLDFDDASPATQTAMTYLRHQYDEIGPIGIGLNKIATDANYDNTGQFVSPLEWAGQYHNKKTLGDTSKLYMRMRATDHILNSTDEKELAEITVGTNAMAQSVSAKLGFDYYDSRPWLEEQNIAAAERREDVANFFPNALQFGDQALRWMGRSIGGGARDFAQGALNVGDDLNNMYPLPKIVWGPGIDGFEIRSPGDEGYDEATITLPDVPHGGGGVEEAVRGITQFMVGFGTAGGFIKLHGLLRVGRDAAAGGLADATFDPELGNFSTMLREMEIDNAVTKFLDSKVGEDATHEERLRARALQVLEGAALGFLIEPVMKTFVHLKRNGLGGTLKDVIAAAEDMIPEPGQLNMGIGPVKKNDWAGVKDPALKAEARRIRVNHLRKDGWAALEPVSGSYDKLGKPVVKFKKIPYGFHNPPGKMKESTWRTKLANRMASDVASIVKRAEGGDDIAKHVISQARWYRSMRVRLRNEFGGIGDLFADVLGATSAQTNVTANWDNAIEVVRRYSRGEFDTEIDAYLARIGSGEGVDPTKLQQLHKSGEFPLITKAAGQLFNSNSPAATGALIDTFRIVKAGKAPKTLNFSGNLIGYSNDATIDVWAARYLRNIAGKPYIPPVAEQAVAGSHLTKSTFDNPEIGSEFGFAQKVFDEAVTKVNEGGMVKAYDQSLGDLGADDLQAVVWFLEKEKWTAKGWTTRAGEGGSLDLEASLAGSASPGRIKELRKKLNDQKLTPAERTAIEGEINQLSAPLERTIVGISGERPGNVPSNYKQAEMAAEIDDVLRNNDTVVTYKTNSAYGRFAGTNERALDVELVTKQGFDPTDLTQAVIRLGKENDQDAVFLSRVVEDPTPDSVPGLELYFKTAGGPERAGEISDMLTEWGIDGFTFITDARQADRVNVQMGAGKSDAATTTGLRLQYIPEFDVGAAAWKAMSPAEKEVVILKQQDMYEEMVADLMIGNTGDDISSVNLVQYVTDVIERGDYDVRLKGSTGANRTKVRKGPQAGSNGPRSDSGKGNQRTRTVDNGQRSEAGQ